VNYTCTIYLKRSPCPLFSDGRAVHTSMCSPGTGESGARLRPRRFTIHGFAAAQTAHPCAVVRSVRRDFVSYREDIRPYPPGFRAKPPSIRCDIHVANGARIPTHQPHRPWWPSWRRPPPSRFAASDFSSPIRPARVQFLIYIRGAIQTFNQHVQLVSKYAIQLSSCT
jgi:hypothetical protein